MSLSSIGNATSVAASQFIPLSSTSKFASSSDPGTSTGGSSGLSRFASAISDAFASIGISLDGTSDTSTTASTAGSTSTDTTTDASATDGSDALGAFLQSLLAALHGQSAAGSAPPPDDGSSSDQAPPAPPVDASGATGSSSRADDVGRAHHGHGGKLEADLQSLIQELQSSSDTTDTSTPGTTASTTSTPSTDPALATLEKNFDSLVATSGSSSTSGADSLTAFLQSLASALHGAPPTGNVLTAQA